MASPYDTDADEQRTPPIVGNELRNRENKGAGSSQGSTGEDVNDDSTGRSSSAKDLKNKEQEMPPDRSGFSAGDDMREKLGMGYTGKGSNKSKGLSKLYGSKSKLKKKAAIAGAAAGGSFIAGVLVFLALLPLKIESIVSNLENKFSAASSQALDTETENFYSSYVKENVLPALNKKGCKTTVSANCVYGTEGKGAVGKLYASWSQGRLEQKMATNYGIVLSSTGTGAGYNLTVQGHSYKLGSDEDIFNIQGTHGVSTNEARNEIRSAVKKGLKDATLYDKVFFRFKLGKFLEAKYGIKRCVLACKTRDNFSDWGKNKKQAFQAYLVQRVISPMSDSYGLMLQCIISGSCPSSEPDDASSTPDENGEQQRTSPLQNSIDSQLAAFAAKFATEEEGQAAVEKLISNAHDISENGLGKHLSAQILSKALGKEVTSETVGKVLGPVSWVEDISKAVKSLSNIGSEAKDIDYAAESAQAVQLADTFETVAQEAHAGETDATMLGSFSDAFDGTDANGNVSDATSSPLYNDYFGGGTESGKATYMCNDNKPVPSGSSICPEENLAAGSADANEISGYVNSVPFLGDAATVVSAVSGSKWNPVNWLGDLASSVINIIPGVSDFTNWIGQYASQAVAPLIQLVTSKLMPSAISATMSGGRTFNMTAAGFDVMENASAQTELGAAQVSDATAAKIQTASLNEQKQEFDSQSMFARMFSTSSPYSLISHLAVDMPTSFSGITGASLASVMGSPLSSISNTFSALFSHNTAFAAQPTTDPFHVAQNAFTTLPSDPEAYWNANCISGPMGTYDESSDTLDISKWLNNDPSTEVNGQPNTGTDPDTGQSINLKDNPCPLIHSVLQVGGGPNSTNLPKGSTNGGTDSSSPTTTTGSAVSGTAAVLAKQVLANGNILEGPTAKADLQAAANGQTVTPGPISGQSNGSASTGACKARTPVYLNATLLQGMLNIATKYKYEIQDITSGHDCDTGRHPLGRAMDIFQVNGEAIDGHCTDANIQQFLKDTTNIMSQLQPSGKFVNSEPVNMSGIGSCNPADDGNKPSWVPANINYFFDSSDEIHVDVGVAG